MSTDSIARQIPINNTIQVNVRPGDETGLYYILISNLPWQTSWQQLKDHVRTVCSAVERVEIFNESTSGWVCVRGRENYSAAMHLLETTPFNGRPIWVDGRNAKAEIPIRRLVGTPDLPRSPRTPRSTLQVMQYPTGTPPTMSPTTSDYSQWSSGGPILMMSNPTTAYGMHPMPMVVSRDYQDSGSWYTSYDNGYMDNSAIMSTAMHAYPTDMTYQCPQSNDFYGNDPSSTPSYTTGQETKQPRSKKNQDQGQGVVQTEFRKIIIRGLSTWAQNEQIKVLLRSRCGYSGGEVIGITIPQSKDGGNRGYATVTFASESHASRAIEKLHKHKFDGKPLDVRLTNEGVSNTEESRKKHHHSSKHHRDDKEKKESSKSSSSSQEKKDKTPKKGGVVIANGSSKKTSESSRKSH